MITCLDVVIDDHDVGDSAAIGVLGSNPGQPRRQSDLQVKVPSLRQDQPVNLLLIEDRSKVHGILAPGDVTCTYGQAQVRSRGFQTKVVCLQWHVNMLVISGMESLNKARNLGHIIQIPFVKRKKFVNL